VGRCVSRSTSSMHAAIRTAARSPGGRPAPGSVMPHASIQIFFLVSCNTKRQQGEQGSWAGCSVGRGGTSTVHTWPASGHTPHRQRLAPTLTGNGRVAGGVGHADESKGLFHLQGNEVRGGEERQRRRRAGQGGCVSCVCGCWCACSCPAAPRFKTTLEAKPEGLCPPTCSSSRKN
jgi:hypothetical protein